jgi:hypothetical protein
VQFFAGDPHGAVPLGAGGEDDRVVELPKLIDLQVDADVHVPDEPDAFVLHHPVQRDDDGLDPRVVRRDAVPDQAVRGGQPVEDVDGRCWVFRGQDVGGVDAGRSGAHDGDP